MVLEESLGASEFAATLNGDNPQAILKSLKQFTKIVRKERRIALSIEDDESDEDGDSSIEEDEEEPPPKKLKKSEEWKEDTNSYHVPFVGTSVSRSDTAEVMKGQWPTGLLQAYLRNSPLAIEMTSDDLIAPEGSIHKLLIRQKRGKLSRAIYKAYLGALAELITAAIPVKRLKDEVSDTDMVVDNPEPSEHRFLSDLLKKILPGIYMLLVDETDKGRGKQGVFGGCGSLAAPALRVLQNISMISTGNSRLVARYLDEKLVDGVLKSLLRPPPPKKETSEDPKLRVVSKHARVEAINLATTLVQANDSAVATYICTSGNRERKVKPGILFVAFREGLASHPNSDGVPESDDNYLDAVADMLSDSRSFLLEKSRKIHKFQLGELFSRDPLMHLCDFTAHAPPLKGSFWINKETVSSEDSVVDALQNAAEEARQLLFPLLSDPSNSPFLHLKGRESQWWKNEGPQTVRAMIRLLQIPNGGNHIRKFLVYCVTKTPMLLPHLFRAINFPDPKKSFAFVSQLGFVSNILRNGPCPCDCLPSNIIDDGDRDLAEVLLVVVPLKLKQQPIAKALQNGNPLVVLESLKLIKVALEKFGILKSKEIRLRRQTEQLSSMMAKWLPDLQIILSVRTRFDPFATRNKPNALISHCLYSVLESFASVLPSSVRNAKFDWMKLLPGAPNFLKASPLVQRRVLRSLKRIIETCTVNKNLFLNSHKVILEIMLKSKCHIVHSMSRQIALDLMAPLLQSRCVELEDFEYMEFEAACWVDGLTISSLPLFCTLLHDVSQKGISAIAGVSAVWAENKISQAMRLSPLIASLSSVESSRGFSSLIIQVCTRCLVFQRNPIPLAALVCHVGENESLSCAMRSDAAIPLLSYARSLLNFHPEDGPARLELLERLLESSLSSKNTLLTVFKLLNDSPQSENLLIEAFQCPATLEELQVLSKFLIHAILISYGKDDVSDRCWALLRFTTPTILLHFSFGETGNRRDSLLKDIFSIQSTSKGNNFAILDLLATSCPFARNSVFIRNRIEDTTSLLHKHSLDAPGDFLSCQDRRRTLLLLSFLGPALPASSALRIELSLLGDISSKSKKLCVITLQLVLCFAEYSKGPIREGAPYDTDVLKKLYETWWYLSQPKGNLKWDLPALTQIRSHFSALLTNFLTQASVESAIILALLMKDSGDTVLNRCMQFALDGFESQRWQDDSGLLATVLRCDSRIARCLLSRFSPMDAPFSRAWEKGFMDEAALSLLHQSKKFHKDSAYMAFADSILLRAASSLSSVTKSGRQLNSLASLLDMTIFVLKAQPRPHDINGVSEEVLGFLLALLGHEGPPRDPHIKQIIQLATSIVTELNTSDSTTERLLASTLVCLCCKWLPRAYKHLEDTEIGLPCESILDWLLLLVEHGCTYNYEQFQESMKTSSIQKVFRSCLKYGVGGVQGGTDVISAKSLKLVRKLLEATASTSGGLGHLMEEFTIPSPADVFTMITSHSKFLDAVGAKDIVGVDATMPILSVKLELMRLMLYCVIKSSTAIVIEQPVWKILCSSFGAGLTELDTTIRQLFVSYCKRAPEDGFLPFLDEFRWRGCSELDSRENDRWDWLLNGLDINRIRETVSKFPLDDTLELTSRGSDHGHQTSNNHSIGVMDVVRRNDSVDDEADASDGSFLVCERWDKSYPDTRYSPAFLLPLVLGALESGILKSNTETKNDNLGNSPKWKSTKVGPASWNYNDSFVLIAQKLCSKGVISLCLACLSSRCEKVRLVAVSILGLLLRACNTSEARALSSWRERPQLAMLLNAVQRALVLKYISSRTLESQTRVPILYPVVSTFLAKASFSISKPDDAMYVPLNRYFLKTEADHGAFQDMGRLPGFISLFCSSSDDIGQTRKERIWALQLLRDGFLDANCYRLVASCHAPELILTSFENVRLLQYSDDMKGVEYTLLLETMKVLLDYGGSRAALHLLGRLGLLSWMRSLITSRPIAEIFPTVKPRVSFCELVSAAVRAASQNERLRTEDLVHEVCALSQPVMNIYFERLETGKTTDATLIAAVCGALESLSVVLTVLVNEGLDFEETQPVGVSIHQCLEFLRLLPVAHRKRMVFSLSFLPVSFDKDSSAGELCSMLLRYCQGSTQHAVLQVLKRVASILRHFEGEVESEALGILLASRCEFISEKEGFDVWLECLALLTRNKSSEMNREEYVASEVLHSASLKA